MVYFPNDYLVQLAETLIIALIYDTFKCFNTLTQWSFGRSECDRVNNQQMKKQLNLQTA